MGGPSKKGHRYEKQSGKHAGLECSPTVLTMTRFFIQNESHMKGTGEGLMITVLLSLLVLCPKILARKAR